MSYNLSGKFLLKIRPFFKRVPVGSTPATRRQRILLAASLAALVFLPATRSEAVGTPITWGTPTTISADTDVDTSGTLIYAYNVGAAGVQATTVNGVTFAAFAASGNTTVGSATITQSVSLTSNTTYGSTASPFSGLSSSYQTLLSSGDTSNGSFPTFTLTLGGLTSGDSYLVQIWTNQSATANGNTVTNNNTTTLTSVNAVTLQQNTTLAVGGVGQWVTGTFVAGSSAPVITFSQGSTGRPDLNAFEVRDTTAVPEPAGCGLVGLGLPVLLGSLRQRRRSR